MHVQGWTRKLVTECLSNMHKVLGLIQAIEGEIKEEKGKNGEWRASRSFTLTGIP